MRGKTLVCHMVDIRKAKDNAISHSRAIKGVSWKAPTASVLK
jgi:hypothetical protein